jgi:hemolysin D
MTIPLQHELKSDPGLFVLEILLRLHGAEARLDDIRLALRGSVVGIADMLAAARKAGVEARCLTIGWDALSDQPLPAIAALHDGQYLILGRIAGNSALVLHPDAPKPAVMTRAEFEHAWDGRLVLVEKNRSAPVRVARLVALWRQHISSAAQRLLRRLRALPSPTAMALPKSLTKSLTRTLPATTAVTTPAAALATHARQLRDKVVALRPDQNRRLPAEIAFLPAALEIVETPPSPIGRAVAISIAAVFSVALLWSCIGTVDIVAVAPGKVIPGGRTKTVQPFETGVVRAIHVRDGQVVRSGDALVELDTTMSDADLERLRSELMGARLDVARGKAALAGKPDPLTAFVPPAGASATAIAMHRRFLVSQTTEQKAKLASIDQQLKQKEAERATSLASIEKLKATMAPLEQRVAIREQLYQKELGSKLTYLTELQDLVAQQQEIVVQQSRLTEANAAISMLSENAAKASAEYERMLLEELAKAEQKVSTLEQDVIKADQRTRLQKLTAPIDGKVQQLAVHTIGGVVTPAQVLMLIVPSDSALEIEAIVSNRDIGFVEVGQDAAIKIDTFNFTRYGTLQGRVLNISQDAITRNKAPERSSPGMLGSDSLGSEPAGQELVYAARVSLDRADMEIDAKRVRLTAGMAVTVEIKSGTRRIISYLLSPLVRYQHDSLRER